MTAIFPRRGAGTTDTAVGAGVLVSAASLAALGDQLAGRIGPRPDFRAELRRRLVTEALERATTLDREPARRPRVGVGRVARRGLAAAGVAVLVGGGAVGAAAAASSSLPGSGLYPVKRLTEDLRADLRPGSSPAGELAWSVGRRVDELERLVGGGRTPTASRWSAMEAVLQDTDESLVTASRTVPPDALRTALAPQRARLALLLPTLTDAQRPAVQQLADLIDAIPGTATASPLTALAPASAAPTALFDDLVARLRTAAASSQAGADLGLPAAGPASSSSGTAGRGAGSSGATGGGTGVGTASGSPSSGSPSSGSSSSGSSTRAVPSTPIAPSSSGGGGIAGIELPTRVGIVAPATGSATGGGSTSGSSGGSTAAPDATAPVVDGAADTLRSVPGTLGLSGSGG